MTTFNDNQPGDLIELEMRIKESQRRILQAMFVSSEQSKKLLTEAIDRACTKVDVVGLATREAELAVQDAIKRYFDYGPGRTLIEGAVTGALNEALPQLFKKS